jgi:hypothetical protein
VKKLWGKDKVQATLEKLDRLTKVEGLSAGAQTLGVVHGLADNMKVVMGGVPYFRDFLYLFVNILIHSIRRKSTDGWYSTSVKRIEQD